MTRNGGIRSEKVEKICLTEIRREIGIVRTRSFVRGCVIRKLTFHRARKVGAERRRQIVPLWNLFVRKGRKSWADRGRLWKREVFEGNGTKNRNSMPVHISSAYPGCWLGRKEWLPNDGENAQRNEAKVLGPTSF